MGDRKTTRKGRSPARAEVISAFTENDVVCLTGITSRQLQYWDNHKFFTPSLAYTDRSQPYSRLYSFRDVVSLKVINQLRNESKVSLPHLREVKAQLADLGDDMWLKTTLYVVKKKVVFVNPKTKRLEEVVSGQGVLRIPLEIVTGDMQERVSRLRMRDTEAIGKFERKRNRVHNQLVIAGTRIPVSSVKAFADAGYSVGRIRKEYPTLTDEDIQAAINFHAAA